MSGERAAGIEEWLEIVRQEYPLTEVAFVRDLGGKYNLNLQISTGQGVLVVRVSPAWVSAERLGAVQAVREYLRELGWPIPQTVRTRSGEGFVQVHGRLVEVEQYVEPRGTSVTTWPAINAGLPAYSCQAWRITRRARGRTRCLRDPSARSILRV